jgi:hypothetical protein
MRCVILVIKLLISIFKILVVNTKRMLEACEAFVTYESGIILERQGFEVNDEPVWILGREYDTKTSRRLIVTSSQELHSIQDIFFRTG